MHPELKLIVDSDINRGNLKDLLDALATGPGIIPFVGAGLSRPFGFPEWGGFLREQARDAGILVAIEERLGRGEYEEAAGDLQQELGELAFEDAIRRTFGDEIRGNAEAAVRALPALTSGPVLTTNFDRVLETVFTEAGRPFAEHVWGAQPGRVAQALHLNGHLLWKLHGDFNSETDRVLTSSQYTEHYGHLDPAQVDWLKPLPRLFANLLVSRPVLFLGSSLDKDRTVRILDAFRRRYRGVGHYALVADPGDAARRARARDLSNVAVRPIWFPAGRFDLVGPFLTFLAEQDAGSRSRNLTGIASQHARIEEGIDAQRQAFAEVHSRPDEEPQRVVGDPPCVAHDFRGRTGHLRDVGQHLASPVTRLVSLIGPSGIGKTALAVHLLNGVAEDRWPDTVSGRHVDGIAYLSTRTEGITFERLFFACARMVGGAARADLERDWKKDQLDAGEKIRRLLDVLRDGLYVVLLDHVEDLLDADGHFADADLRTLVDASLTSRSGIRLLVTSRARLSLSHEAAKVDQPIVLSQGLSVEDGIAMLRDLDPGGSSGLRRLGDDVLARVVKRLHGVPRALEVFAGILADDDLETVDHLLARFYGREDVVADLFKAGVQRLDAPSQRVVEALSVFGQPAPEAAIDMLLQPFVPGLDLPRILRRLSRGQIVRVADRVKRTWALHPIDQDFAYEQLPEAGRYSRQTLHQRAAEWYASVRPPRSAWRTSEGVEPLTREFDHRVKAGLFDDAAAVLADFDDELRGGLGQGARSLAMHLLIEGRVGTDRLRLLNVLGLAHAYRHVGPLDQAIACYRQSLAMAREQQNAAVEIESLGWMGEVFRRLGRLDEGKPAVTEAVAIAQRIGNRVAVARWLGELGLTCCYRGELDEALIHAEAAHRAAVEVRDVNWEALAIDCLALVHLARGEALKAIQVGQRAIDAYREGTWLHTVIYVLNVQGLAYLDLQQIETAIDCLRRANAEARVVEDIRVDGMTQFNLAHAYRLKPDIGEAVRCAEEAVRSLRRTGGGELPAAQALADALKARAAGFVAAEARALVAAARGSFSNPDLRHPRGILADAMALARQTSQPEVVADAEELLATIRAREQHTSAAASG